MSDKPTTRAVFLDRDGVLNRSLVVNGVPHPPADASALELLPGVERACQLLRQAGFKLVVVTNQPDVARGSLSRSAIEGVNNLLTSMLPLDDVRVCYHDNVDGCGCRKPKPGMLTSAAAELGIDLPASFMVGDRWVDIEAGKSAGCRTVLITGDHAEPLRTRPDHVAGSLLEAAGWILEQTGK